MKNSLEEPKLFIKDIKRLIDKIYVWVCYVVVLDDFSDCVVGHWNP
jgi:hypothetical protein